jgi:hypothetical protein
MDIHSYVGLATNLQVREGINTVLPQAVGALEAVRSKLEVLQCACTADQELMQAVAAAAAKRMQEKVQIGSGLTLALACRWYMAQCMLYQTS